MEKEKEENNQTEGPKETVNTAISEHILIKDETTNEVILNRRG